jgi:hypothetical protein
VKQVGRETGITQREYRLSFKDNFHARITIFLFLTFACPRQFESNAQMSIPDTGAEKQDA